MSSLVGFEQTKSKVNNRTIEPDWVGQKKQPCPILGQFVENVEIRKRAVIMSWKIITRAIKSSVAISCGKAENKLEALFFPLAIAQPRTP